MPNAENLIPNSDRTPSERRDNASKAGKASGKARRAKRTMREVANHIRFHDLRQSCASLLNANGCSLKDIQEWLGHSDIQTTANIYTHLNIERKASIMETMEKQYRSEVLEKVLEKCCKRCRFDDFGGNEKAPTANENR